MSFARQIMRRQKRKEEAAAKRWRRKVLLEPLEPRLLLSADLSYTMTGTSEDLTIKYDSALDQLQLLDDLSTPLVSASLAGETSASVSVTGTGGDDTLSFDFVGMDSLTLDSLDISFDGEEGADTLSLVGNLSNSGMDLSVSAESITVDSGVSISADDISLTSVLPYST